MNTFTVCYSDPCALSAAGYGKVAHLPFILDARPGYHRLGSQYLIDRGLGIWSPKHTKTGEPRIPPTEKSLHNYACWLANFLEWAEHRGVDIKTCTYQDHIYGRYQKELQLGAWSRDGIGLSANTVNTYVDQACDFLKWLSVKGKREPFAIPTITVVSGQRLAVDAYGHRGIQVEVRKGKVRQKKRRLIMPNDEQIDIWLSSIYKNKGDACGLMCELVLMSAMRRSEVVGFRVDTLPINECDWHISNPTAEERDQLVRISIKYGTKGRSYGKDNGDKIGPERDIDIPLHFARRLHAYRQKARPAAISIWIKQVRGAAAQRQRLDGCVHFFRDEKTGARIESWQFYEAWKSGQLPFKGWSPHLGRDWWACSVLWREIHLHQQMLSFKKNAPTALIAAVATDIIRLRIQSQLGHANTSTCFIYLVWVSDMLGIALPEKYQEHLDAYKETTSDKT